MSLPDLKAQMLRDLDTVFHDPRNFSEKMRLEYQGKEYLVWAQMEEEGTAIRDLNNNQRKNDKEKVLYQYDKYLWLRRSELGFVPRARRHLTVNGVEYDIREVSVEFGEILLTLRRLTE